MTQTCRGLDVALPSALWNVQPEWKETSPGKNRCASDAGAHGSYSGQKR